MALFMEQQERVFKIARRKGLKMKNGSYDMAEMYDIMPDDVKRLLILHAEQTSYKKQMARVEEEEKRRADIVKRVAEAKRQRRIQEIVDSSLVHGVVEPLYDPVLIVSEIETVQILSSQVAVEAVFKAKEVNAVYNTHVLAPQNEWRGNHEMILQKFGEGEESFEAPYSYDGGVVVSTKYGRFVQKFKKKKGHLVRVGASTDSIAIPNTAIKLRFGFARAVPRGELFRLIIKDGKARIGTEGCMATELVGGEVWWDIDIVGVVEVLQQGCWCHGYYHVHHLVPLRVVDAGKLVFPFQESYDVYFSRVRLTACLNGFSRLPIVARRFGQNGGLVVCGLKGELQYRLKRIKLSVENGVLGRLITDGTVKGGQDVVLKPGGCGTYKFVREGSGFRVYNALSGVGTLRDEEDIKDWLFPESRSQIDPFLVDGFEDVFSETTHVSDLTDSE